MSHQITRTGIFHGNMYKVNLPLLGHLSISAHRWVLLWTYSSLPTNLALEWTTPSSLGQIIVSLGKAWKHCEDHVPWFLQCFQHRTACTFGGQAGAHRVNQHLTFWILIYLTNPSMWGLGSVCWTQLSAVWMSHRNNPGPVSVHPVHCRLLPVITIQPSTKALWRLCYRQPHQGRGRQSLQRTYSGLHRLMPAEPPPAQQWQDQRAGGGFLQAQTTLHTGEHQTLRWWHLTYTWVFTWTINWTRLITLQQYIRKVE